MLRTVLTARRSSGGALGGLALGLVVSLAPPATLAADGDVSEVTRALCQQYAEIRSPVAYMKPTYLQRCLTFARSHPGQLDGVDPAEIHGQFRYGRLICDGGFAQRGDKAQCDAESQGAAEVRVPARAHHY